MLALVLGIVLWSLTHLFPSVFAATRARLAGKVGENVFRGLFSLVIIGALTLIIVGWRSATPATLYSPPLAAGFLPSLLMLVSFVLFFASQLQGNIKRHVRHPQMAATVLWGVTHLLTNGDLRGVALFGGFTLWAIVEVVAINRRDGAWQKPAAAALRIDAMTIVVATLAFIAMLYFHATLFGVPASSGP